MQRANVGMIQAGDGFGFALEALAERRIVGEMRRKNLYGYTAVQARIPRPIYFAHPSCTNRRQDLVGTQFDAIRQPHGWCGL